MPRSAAYPDADYNFGVTRVRQNNGAPTAQAPVAAPTYAPPPPAYTINQSAQHQNAIADVDRQIAAERDPTIKARLVAQKNEMQYAYRNHQPYPDLASRALDQQNMKTGVSVANAQVAGQTAVGAMKATAPVAAAAINSQGRVEAAKATGESRQNVAATNAQARQFSAQESARARIIAAKIKAASSIGGVMPSPEDQKYLKDFIEKGGSIDAPVTPTLPAPSLTPPTPTTTQSAESTATQRFPALEGTPATLPTIDPVPLAPPAIPQAFAADFENPFTTSVPELAPRPKPVTGDAADPNSKTGVTVKVDPKGLLSMPINEQMKRQSADDQAFHADQDQKLAAWRAYRATDGNNVSFREFNERIAPAMAKRDEQFNNSVPQVTARAEDARRNADQTQREAATSRQRLNDYQASGQGDRDFVAQRTSELGSSLPTVNPPQAAPVAQRPTPVAPAATQPAPLPTIAATTPSITPTPPTLLTDEQFEQRYGTLRTPTQFVPQAQPSAPPAPVAQTATPTAAPRMTPNPDGTFSNPQFPGVRYMKVTGGYKRI